MMSTYSCTELTCKRGLNFFLADRADRVALIVVRRIDQRLVRQLQQPVEDGAVLIDGISVLEVGSSGPADKQRIAGENPVAHEEAVGIARVTRRVDRVETDALDLNLFAVHHSH